MGGGVGDTIREKVRAKWWILRISQRYTYMAEIGLWEIFWPRVGIQTWDTWLMAIGTQQTLFSALLLRKAVL